MYYQKLYKEMATAPGIPFTRIKVEDESINNGQVSSEANLKIDGIYPEKIKCEASSSSENSNSATIESFAHNLKTEAGNDASKWVKTIAPIEIVAKVKEEQEEKSNVTYELVGSSPDYSNHQIGTSLPMFRREINNLNRVKLDDKSNVTHILVSSVQSSPNLQKDKPLQFSKSENDKLASREGQNYWNGRVENSHLCKVDSDREFVEAKACEKIYFTSKTESKVHYNLENIKLVTVSVKLVDLFSSDVRRLGKAHSNNSLCSCIYCNVDYLYSSNSLQCLSENSKSKGGSAPVLLGKNLNESGRSVGLNVREEKQESGREKNPREKHSVQLDERVKTRENSFATLLQSITFKNRKTHPVEKKFLICKLCPVKFKYYTQYAKHYLQMHGINKSFSCNVCSAAFKCMSDLRKHKSCHSDERLFNCALCTSKFKCKKVLGRHLVIHSTEKPYCCNKCSATFKQRDSLRTHKLSHTNEKSFSCNICSSKFKCKRNLDRHLVIHSNKKPFRCNECSATFTQRGSLNTHMRSHTNERPFSCNICSSKFKCKRNLDRHLVIHSNKKPFRCNECSATFTQRGSLNTHMRSHTNERPFSCNICSATFARSDVLSKHKVRHSEERLFSCALCPLRFKCKDVLKGHLNMHNSERPFKCNKCYATFKKRYSLSTHMQSHSHERLFTCALCSMKFNLKGTLCKHLKVVHNSENPFKCQQCSASYRLVRHLKAHIRVHVDANPLY